MSDRNTRLTRGIFEAFKYLEDCLKSVYHMLQLLGGKYAKIYKNKDLSCIIYTDISRYLEQKLWFLQHEKPYNLLHYLELLAKTFFFGHLGFQIARVHCIYLFP